MVTTMTTTQAGIGNSVEWGEVRGTRAEFVVRVYQMFAAYRSHTVHVRTFRHTTNEIAEIARYFREMCYFRRCYFRFVLFPICYFRFVLFPINGSFFSDFPRYHTNMCYFRVQAKERGPPLL